MSTHYENIKGKNCVSPDIEALVKASHEHASGKSSGPRGAANSFNGRQSKATKNARKK